MVSVPKVQKNDHLACLDSTSSRIHSMPFKNPARVSASVSWTYEPIKENVVSKKPSQSPYGIRREIFLDTKNRTQKITINFGWITKVSSSIEFRFKKILPFL